MAFLHNRVSRRELRRRLSEEKVPRVTFSFYRYVPIPDPQAFRNRMFADLSALRVFGRVYVAAEGVNGQASVPLDNFETCRQCLWGLPGLDAMRLNVAVEDDGKSFWVLTIKTRDKIVADGIEDPSFCLARKGAYVDAEGFNELTDQPDTIVVDMRNHYEFEVGHFDNAIEVPSDTFREQLPMALDLLRGHEDKPIVMYCTGGIRCEKASAWMLHNGFTRVYHLEGGIVEYARKVREEGLRNKFKGKNFVFDGRMGERITEDVVAQCHQCGAPCDTHTNCENEACHLLFIQCPACAEKYKGCCSEECKEALEGAVAAGKSLSRAKRLHHKSLKSRRPDAAGLSGAKEGPQ